MLFGSRLGKEVILTVEVDMLPNMTYNFFFYSFGKNVHNIKYYLCTSFFSHNFHMT